MSSNCARIVIIAPCSDLCIAISSDYDVVVVSCGFLFDAGECVVDLLYVLVCVSSMWKICGDISQAKLSSGYVDIGNSFIYWDKLFDERSPLLVHKKPYTMGVSIVSGTTEHMSIVCYPTFFGNVAHGFIQENDVPVLASEFQQQFVDSVVWAQASYIFVENVDVVRVVGDRGQ